MVSYGSTQYSLDLDSLKKSLSTQADDTAKIATLLQLSKGFNQLDKEVSRKYCDEMYRLSVKLDYLPGVVDAMNEKCVWYIFTSQYDSAKMICDTVIKLCATLGDKSRLANIYLNYGALLYRKNLPEKANEYYMKSQKLYQAIADSFGIANAYNGLGAIFWDQSKYDSAIYCYLELIKICSAKKYDQVLIKGYINIGALYYERGNNDKAAPYFYKSIELGKKLNKLIFLSHAYQNLGNILYKQKDYDSAWVHYQKAIDYSKKLNYHLGLSKAYIGMGNISLNKEDYKKAAHWYSRSMNSSLKVDDKSDYLIAYINMAIIQERMGNYMKALLIYDSCLILADELGSLYRKREIYYDIYQSYYLQADYKNAFENLLKYDSLNDSIFNLKKKKIITDLELKYEKGKLLADNLALENENLLKDVDLKKRTNQRNVYLFTGLGSIFVLFFIIAVFYQRTRKNKIIAEHKIEQLEEEKKLLAAGYIIEGQEEERKRIAEELHDGLGVLLSSAKIHFTSVRKYLPENSDLIDKASQLLEDAVRDVRRISHKMMPGLLTKFGLLEGIEDIIDTVNDMEGISASIEVIGEYKRIKENKEIMLFRIIQEMINNTLKHAHAKTIILRFEMHPDQLKIDYMDDGDGFDLRDNTHEKSLGLSSINSRVNFLKGEVELKTSSGNGVNYQIRVPIKNDDFLTDSNNDHVS